MGRRDSDIPSGCVGNGILAGEDGSGCAVDSGTYVDAAQRSCNQRCSICPFRQLASTGPRRNSICPLRTDGEMLGASADRVEPAIVSAVDSLERIRSIVLVITGGFPVDVRAWFSKRAFSL